MYFTLDNVKKHRKCKQQKNYGMNEIYLRAANQK